MTVIASTVFALLLAEVILRVFDIRPERYESPRWLVAHEGTFKNFGIWGNGLIKQPSRFPNAGIQMGEYVPGTSFKVQYDTNPRGYFDEDNAVLMTVNARGLRDKKREVSIPAPAGIYRILGLGDSFTFGVGVRDEDTFLQKLENKLNASTEPPRRYEVLNAGVQGYNTRDEVIYLERHWLPMGLDPELVLIFFYLNDAYADHAFLNMGETLGIQLKQPEGLARRSWLYDLAQHKYHVREVTAKTEAYYNQPFFADAATFLKGANQKSADWSFSREALEAVSALCRDRGIKVGVVIFPELLKLRGSYPFTQIHDTVTHACRSFGMPVLDLLETYKGQDERDLWVHPSDHHPNEIAHAQAADTIEAFVRREFLEAKP